MAAEPCFPSADCAHPAGHAEKAPSSKAWGLAIWVSMGTGPDPSDAVIDLTAQLLLERAQRIAPEAEVHIWPVTGAATSAVGMDPEEGLAGSGTMTPSSSASEDSPREDDDGSSDRPLSGIAPGRISVDLCADQLLLDGKPVMLTAVESRVLQHLAKNCSRPVRREELQILLETPDFPGREPRSIDVYVGRLRRKLGAGRHAIATIRGGGYQFTPGPRVTIRGPAEYAI